MDQETIQFYQKNAQQLSEQYFQVSGAIDKYFQQAFAPKAKILDIGSGSGRDLLLLQKAGFDAYGIDLCSEFVETVTQAYPEFKERNTVDSLPDLETVDDKSYHGILCSSVLMHLPENLLFDSAYNIKRVLKDGARLLISVPLHDETICPDSRRDQSGRLFNGVTPENFQLIFERLGFSLINRWDDEDAMNRSHRRWSTLLFSLKQSGTASLDIIEGVLNKDKKDATYKLALFRALAEIATTQYNSAIWLIDGRVSLDIELISRKWLEYYWPLLESETFIPQKRGEYDSAESRQIAFRKELNALIELYRSKGGLSAYTIESRGNVLSKTEKALEKKVLSKLRSTIISGPIKYAGGEGSGLFCYDKNLKSIVLCADLWRELSIMGTWIQDTIILRWAELTTEISQNEIKASLVIDQLLTNPIAQRDTFSARKLFDQLPSKNCVWSDKAISTKYDVDHAIPFALWKNNDLWNLFPANSKVNGNKSDKLPTHHLLQKRKDAIIYYWEQLRQSYETRFDFEAKKFSGSKTFSQTNWQNTLFHSLSEAIEITATRRAVERWEPAV